MYHDEDHDSHLCKEMRDLWRSRKLCDINVMVEREATNGAILSIGAHKVVLAATIPYFRTLFTAPGNQDAISSGQVVLKDLEGDGVKRIVGYAYTGKLEITDSAVHGILSAAAFLGLSDLVDACGAHISAQLTPGNCLGAKRFATRHGARDLLWKATDYATENFLSVTLGNEFLELSPDDLENLIKDDRINMNREEDVYEAVSRWIQHDPSRQQSSLRVYSHVRFPVMAQSYLAEVVSRHPFFQSLAEGHVILKEALDYHDNPSTVFTMTAPHKAQPRSSTQGFVCVLGGMASTAGDILADVTILNPHKGTWRQGTKMTTPRCRFSAAILDGDLYAIGGTDLISPLSTVEKFSTRTGAWTQVASLGYERRDCAAVVAGKRIFLLGGFSGSVFLKSAELYNPDLDEWSYHPAMLEGRSELAAVYMSKHLYAIGGFSDSGKLRSVERFDFLNRTWERVSDMCVQRANLAATVVGQEIFVCGGQIDGEVLNHAEIYSMELDQWEPIAATMAQPRMGLGMVTMGTTIYVLGGSNGVEHLSSVECYDSIQHKWFPGPTLPNPRFGAAAVVLSKHDPVATTVH